MNVRTFVFVGALAAGTLAAAQTPTQQPPAKPPAKPPAGSPSAQPPATQPPGSTTTGTQPPAGQTTPGQPVAGQAPAVPVPAPPPLPAVPASRKFTSDSGIMFSTIYANKTADYEAVLARVKEALAKSDDPKRKQMALSWRVLKGLEAGPGGNVVYVWLLDPAVKDIDYSITTILSEAFPNEAQDLWAKYVACFVNGQTMLNLQQVLTMGPAGTVTVPK